jgi:hypothetical protein
MVFLRRGGKEKEGGGPGAVTWMGLLRARTAFLLYCILSAVYNGMSASASSESR